MTILIQSGKGKKDRVLALSPVLLVMLRAYAQEYKPQKQGYLFAGVDQQSSYSVRSLQEVLHTAKAGIIKPGAFN